MARRPGSHLYAPHIAKSHTSDSMDLLLTPSYSSAILVLLVWTPERSAFRPWDSAGEWAVEAGPVGPRLEEMGPRLSQTGFAQCSIMPDSALGRYVALANEREPLEPASCCQLPPVSALPVNDAVMAKAHNSAVWPAAWPAWRRHIGLGAQRGAGVWAYNQVG